MWDWFKNLSPKEQRDQVKGKNVSSKRCADCEKSTVHNQERGNKNNAWICVECGATWVDPKHRGN